MKLPSFPAHCCSCVHDWLLPRGLVTLRLSSHVPHGAGSCPPASPPGLLWPVCWPPGHCPLDSPSPCAAVGQPPVFSHSGQECGLPLPGSGLPGLLRPSPSWQMFRDKDRTPILGRLASLQLVRVDFRSGSAFSLLLWCHSNSGRQGLLGDRNMVLRSQNSDPLCGILGNIPVCFKPCYPTWTMRPAAGSAWQLGEDWAGTQKRLLSVPSGGRAQHRPGHTTASLLVQNRGGGLLPFLHPCPSLGHFRAPWTQALLYRNPTHAECFLSMCLQ